MGKMRKKLENERRIKWHGQVESILKALVDILLVLFTVISTYLSFYIRNLPYGVEIVLLVIAGIVIISKAVFFTIQLSDNRKYAGIRKAEELSTHTLKAFKDANAAKRKYILQSTYGRVPKWHPTDYTQNILVYDVHEQIRSILTGLQKMIVDTTEGLTEDQVTVDLVYCYPRQINNGSALQIQVQPHTRNNEWRIITSGNHSLGGSIHSYLSNKASFYHHVDDCGYCFCNDKKECIESGHYIISDKDKEQKSKGSIVGLKMELRNDEPETVFVQAILTITTYGKKLYENELIKQSEYEEIFKENVINGYRSFLLSELSQMYIRHAILEGDMCPRTGAILSEAKENGGGEHKKQTNKTCKITGKDCKFCNSQSCCCDR